MLYFIWLFCYSKWKVYFGQSEISAKFNAVKSSRQLQREELHSYVLEIVFLVFLVLTRPYLLIFLPIDVQ